MLGLGFGGIWAEIWVSEEEQWQLKIVGGRSGNLEIGLGFGDGDRENGRE